MKSYVKKIRETFIFGCFEKPVFVLHCTRKNIFQYFCRIYGKLKFEKKTQLNVCK